MYKYVKISQSNFFLISILSLHSTYSESIKEFSPDFESPISGIGGFTLKLADERCQVHIPDRTCRLNRSEFSVVFCETGVNASSDSLERLPMEGTPLVSPDPS